MTEDDAKQKWCPFARVVQYSSNDGGPPPAPGNRCILTANVTEALNGATTCIGSQCMAWRWSTVETPDQIGLPDGYCGLAGKP